MTVATGRWLRAVAGIGLLAIIAVSIDLRAAIELLRRADWRWLLLAVAIVQVQVVASAVRWQLTAVRLGQALGLPRAIREYYLATLANLSLPGGVAGDAARVYRNRQATTMSVAARSVMIERLAGQLALAAVTAIGWLSWPLLMRRAAPDVAAWLLGVLLVVAGVVTLLGVAIARAGDNRVARFFRDFGPALHSAWWQDHQWIRQGLLSVFIVATYLAVFAVCALALGRPLSFAAVITVVPLVLLSMVIPLSIGGWGVREAAAASLWPLAGLSAEAGVATSVLYGLVSVTGSLPGAVWTWVLPAQDR